jgi:hypothetical protein
MSMKNSDIIGNQSRNFLVCSAVPQPLRRRVPPLFNVNDKNNLHATADMELHIFFGVT